jgi:hypothetical protein
MTRRFLEWIGKAIPNLNKAYSADQPASLSKLPGDKIQELARLGLLDERAGRLAFAIWQVLGRSRNCSRREYNYRKSSVA